MNTTWLFFKRSVFCYPRIAIAKRQSFSDSFFSQNLKLQAISSSLYKANLDFGHHQVFKNEVATLLATRGESVVAGGDLVLHLGPLANSLA